VNLAAPPTFSGCTDSFGGTDTVTASGTWTLVFTDAAGDERAEKPGDTVTLNIPQAGLTTTSSVAPGCTVTDAPTGPARLSASYDDSGTATFTSNSVPISGSGCTTSADAVFSQTLTLSTAIADVS
jgi:hypothetical protein